MFLTSQTNGIEDFLKAVNFITPEGMELKYFVVPNKAGGSSISDISNIAHINGFEPKEDNPNNLEGITDTIVYAKKDFSNKQSISDDKINVTEIPEQFPITNRLAQKINMANNAAPVNQIATQSPVVANPLDNREPIKTDILIGGGEVLPQNSGVKIIESTEKFVDLILKEELSVFPKNTILHFVRG